MMLGGQHQKENGAFKKQTTSQMFTKLDNMHLNIIERNMPGLSQAADYKRGGTQKM